MMKFSFFRPVLDSLTDSKILRISIGKALRILGIVSIVGGIYLIVDILKQAFDLRTEGTIGGLVFAVMIAGAVLSIFQILFFRGKHIEDLQESELTIIPIFSILFKAVGEIYGTFMAAIGVGGCVYIWLAKSDPMYLLGSVERYLPTIPGESTFLGGIMFLVYALVWGFIALIVSYFLGEASIVLADIAGNGRHTRGAQHRA